MSKIKVIYVAPGKDAEEREVENTLEAMQEFVGGHIETVTFAADCVVICNAEGRINGMQYNCRIANVDFYGPVVISGVEGDELASFPVDVGAFTRYANLRGARDGKTDA